jgi:nucleotide-binding universal stress UspA family protein
MLNKQEHMKTIIAPTDFSEISVNAVKYAAGLACIAGTRLSLIHICPFPVLLGRVPAPVNDIVQIATAAEAIIQQLKERLAVSTCDRIKIDTIVKQGDVLMEIDNYCASVNPYAVVMGTAHSTAFERFFAGGKTIAAMQQLSWPLIVVPPGAEFSNIRKIGLACDFKKVVETIPLHEIRSLAAAFDVNVYVLHVGGESDEMQQPEAAEESQWLKDMLKEFKPSYHFISGDDIEKGIRDFAEKNELDLLIVVPKKHDPADGLFHQSLSRKLVLHTHIPVMAVHE